MNFPVYQDKPQGVFFFAKADAIGGLHTPANFDYTTKDAVISPLGSGCDSLIGITMKQVLSGGNKCIPGLFDPPARACIRENLMTFSAPFTRFLEMVSNMDGCFLNIYVWENVSKRMKKELVNSN